MFYVYLLKSIRFDEIYIGSTKDLKRRLKEHNDGKSFSTKPYLPWKLMYYEAFDNEAAARIRERNLKYNGNAVRELKKRIFSIKSGAGYTLIEILVVLTIIGILFNFGYVNFRDFSRRQALAGVVKQVQGDLRLAQGEALAGQKPKPIDVKCSASGRFLVGINFHVISTGFGGSYALEYVCSGGTVSTPIKTVDLGTDISISNTTNPILFKVLGNGSTASTITLKQKITNDTTAITVTSGGEIK